MFAEEDDNDPGCLRQPGAALPCCMGFARVDAFAPDSDTSQKIFLPGPNALPVLLTWGGGWRMLSISSKTLDCSGSVG